jgi:hypothetical protein
MAIKKDVKSNKERESLLAILKTSFALQRQLYAELVSKDWVVEAAAASRSFSPDSSLCVQSETIHRILGRAAAAAGQQAALLPFSRSISGFS